MLTTSGLIVAGTRSHGPRYGQGAVPVVGSEPAVVLNRLELEPQVNVIPYHQRVQGVGHTPVTAFDGGAGGDAKGILPRGRWGIPQPC